MQLNSLLNNEVAILKAQSIISLFDILEKDTYKIILLDIDHIPDESLADVLKRIHRNQPDVFLIALTSVLFNNNVRKSLPQKMFLFEYSAEGLHDLKIFINYVWEYQSAGHFSKTDDLAEVNYIGEAPIMKRLLHQVRYITNLDIHVLLTGETGSGKTELARYIHNKSKRRRAPFLDINCAAIPDNLLEAELFGFKKGSFTGAIKDTAGKFHAAGHGTICLDEIGEIPLHLQSKLLKVLDEKEYFPLGATNPEVVHARIIAATNKDIVSAVKEKKFREDLYYRLNVIEVYIPPLRERREDIPIIFRFLVQKAAQSYNLPVPEIDAAVNDVLINYDWRGNIREMQNKVELIMSRKPLRIKVQDLPEALFTSVEANLIRSVIELMPLEHIKKDYARRIYSKCAMHQKKTAHVLGIDRKTLCKLLADK